MYDKEYVPPTVTVDSVIFEVDNSKLKVALIKRSNDPFEGKWSLPGGYSAKGQTTFEAVYDKTLAKAGIDLKKQVKYVEQLYTFDTIARDPRGHAVAITYMACGIDIKSVKSSEETEFMEVDSLGDLAFDHKQIIKLARERLASKLGYTNLAYSLLPKKFTLTQLQFVYEAVLGRNLDKRNFRKKITKLNILKETDEYFSDGAHRPAKLHEFKRTELVTLDKPFE
jgi:8-oxo-dGTP diphosphatase